MKHLRYYAEFYDRKDRKYRVELYQESETAYDAVEVELAADPVTIEWQEVGKLDPVRGSGATLRLISMTDRQFYDMYSVDYGVIELNVLREENGAFKPFWLGTLDPELFSEPYAYADRYVTELTFVDFAVLDYAMWDGVGQMSVEDVVVRCLQAARITNADMPRAYHISTTAKDSTGATISPLQCVISAENFYDEDGEAMTMREVLEEVLRPFALQLVQRNAQIFICDTNALATLTPEQIEWYSDDATLEADVVYNNAVVKFSPDDIQDIVELELDPEEVLQSVGLSKTMSGIVKGENEPTNWFTLHWGGFGKYEKFEVKNGASLFRIEPFFSGDDEAGFLWGASFPDASGESGWWPNQPFCLLTSEYPIWPKDPCTPIVSFDTIPVFGSDNSQNTKLLVSLDFLYEARANPFESADFYANPDDGMDYDDLNSFGVYGYLPVAISLWSSDGVCKYRYSNNFRRHPGGANNDQNIGWYRVSDEADIYKYPAWLCYYDGNLGGRGVFDGWATNKKIVGRPLGSAPILTAQDKKRNNGEYIDLPPESGFLKIEILAGVMLHLGDHTPIYMDGRTTYYNATYGRVRGWVAYKNLKVRYVPKYGSDDDYKQTDFEVSGYINKLAREELSIDTIIGTAGDTVMARGDIRDSAGVRLTEFSRGGYKNRLEQLLIGTAYSQYANRKNVLSGTVEAPQTFGVLSDATIDGKYMVVSEVMNVEDATSEIRAIEVVADNYEEIEEVEE